MKMKGIKVGIEHWVEVFEHWVEVGVEVDIGSRLAKLGLAAASREIVFVFNGSQSHWVDHSQSARRAMHKVSHGLESL